MRTRIVLLRLIAVILVLLPLAVRAAHSKTSLEYRHIPFESFRYVDGMLTATWDAERYDVGGVALSADYEPIVAIEPGKARPVALDAGKARYDLTGWMIDRATGERSRFISPVWTPAGFTTGSVFEDSDPLSCILTETVDCPDGTTVSVTCSGQTGSCVSCSSGKTACCRASNEVETTHRDGRIVRQLVITRDSDTCPQPIEPRPGQ